MVLLVTVIGIPIALFLPFVFVAVVYAGQIAASYVLGCKLTRRRLGEGGFTAPLLSGSLLVASIFGFGAILWETPGIVRTVALFFLLVGGLLVVGLTTIGAGAFLLSRAGSRPADVDGLSPGGTPAPARSPLPQSGQGLSSGRVTAPTPAGGRGEALRGTRARSSRSARRARSAPTTPCAPADCVRVAAARRGGRAAQAAQRR
jgi:hypothetical protein